MNIDLLLRTRRALAALALALLGTAAWAQPAQSPLLSRDGGGVKPNIVVTLDNSSSMLSRYMPETTVRLYTWSFAMPNGGNEFRYHPNDTLDGHSRLLSSDPAEATASWAARLMRSGDVNTVYYNPKIRYRPWPTPAGTGRLPNASPTAAPNNPLNLSAAPTANLTTITTVTFASGWCFRNGSNSCSSTSASDRFDPGMYYVLKTDPSTGKYLSPTLSASYVAYSINSGTATYTKHPKRLDCSGATCTRDEERQNFANWYTYFRSRQLLQRGAVGEAFFDQPDEYRLGYGSTGKSAASTIDGLSIATLSAGVRDLTTTTRAQFITWTYNLSYVTGTPLRRVMNDVGRYYQYADNRGPWGDSPGTLISGAHKTCRRAYHIMVTDGYWNTTNEGTVPSWPGNSDDSDGSTISGAGGKSFKYVPVRPYRDSSSDRLADIAMKYWKTDLRTLDNKVVPSAENPAFWQHMVNFTVGLGVRGVLDPATDLPALTSGAKSWGHRQDRRSMARGHQFAGQVLLRLRSVRTGDRTEICRGRCPGPRTQGGRCGHGLQHARV
jgi:type IV pilus assembly protein PilY1